MDLTAHGDRHRDDRHHAEKRAINEGFSDAMARAVELVVTPLIFGFLGFLDRWLGTEPVFMLALGGFTLGYVVWRMKSGYDAEMAKHEDLMRAPREGGRVVNSFAAMVEPMPADVPEVEKAIAFDMLKRGVWVAPAIIVVAGMLRGTDGAASAAVGVAVVLVNLVLSAVALSWAAKISAGALMAVAMGGFLVRMMLVTGVVLLVRDESWIDLPTLAVTILLTHLGLLFWELKYVSASLAFPGLKPDDPRPGPLPQGHAPKEAPRS